MPSQRIASFARSLKYAGAGFAAWRMHRGKNELVRRKAGRHVAERLGRLRGLPQKMGQLLSMSFDQDQAENFSSLTDAAPPLPLPELLPLMAEAWNRDPHNVCQSIELHGHAASLGQVHRATLADGTDVAIKIQYPGLLGALETDLSALGWIAAPIGSLKAGFDLGAYQRAIRTSLEEETDYRAEARNQVEYSKAAARAELDLICPQVIQELSTDRVLTTQWEAGEDFSSTLAWNADERRQLAEQLLDHFLVMLFEYGLIHADPHPGNYRFRRTETGLKVVLYDYGCVHRMQKTERLALLKLITEATKTTDDHDPFPLFVALGFDPTLLQPLRRKLPALVRILFEPFGTESPFDLSQWNLSQRVEQVLGEDRLNFRIAGPARMLFFLRAFHGLIYYLRKLEQSISWSAAINKIDRHQYSGLAPSLPELTARQNSDYSGLASKLCIRVLEHGLVRAKLSLPAKTIERLEDFIEESIRQKISERGIDLPSIIEQARKLNFAPQPLFEASLGAKVFKVWLE